MRLWRTVSVRPQALPGSLAMAATDLYRVVSIARMKSSVNGNPRYRIGLESPEHPGVILSLPTRPDAGFAYAIGTHMVGRYYAVDIAPYRGRDNIHNMSARGNAAGL